MLCLTCTLEYHYINLIFVSVFFFFFHVPPTTKLYTLSLHDALPIFASFPSAATRRHEPSLAIVSFQPSLNTSRRPTADRKSTRLNSSHLVISYAVFCLKKKNINI